MNDIKEIEKSADEDIRTFGQLIDMVVDELTCGQEALPEAETSALKSKAVLALMDYQDERRAQADADIGMIILKGLFFKLR